MRDRWTQGRDLFKDIKAEEKRRYKITGGKGGGGFERKGTVVERRKGQRRPEAEHDGLRPQGAI